MVVMIPASLETCALVSLALQGQLWRLLDVASAAEPDWSEQGANVRNLKALESRQLGGVQIEVALATSVVVVVVAVGSISLTFSQLW